MRKLLVVLAIAVVALWGVYKLASRGPSRPEPIGRDGKPVAFTPAQGKITLVHFWGTWCGPCRMELPSFVDFANAHRDRLTYIAVADDKSFDDVDKFLGAQQLKLNTYIDPSGGFRRSWKVTAIPTTFVLDTKGNVVAQYVGLTNWSDRFIESEVMKFAQ